MQVRKYIEYNYKTYIMFYEGYVMQVRKYIEYNYKTYIMSFEGYVKQTALKAALEYRVKAVGGFTLEC